MPRKFIHGRCCLEEGRYILISTGRRQLQMHNVPLRIVLLTYSLVLAEGNNSAVCTCPKERFSDLLSSYRGHLGMTSFAQMKGIAPFPLMPTIASSLRLLNKLVVLTEDNKSVQYTCLNENYNSVFSLYRRTTVVLNIV